MSDRDLDAAVHRSFAGEAAPPHLRARITEELERRGLIRAPRQARRARLRLALAAIVLAGAGLAVHLGTRSAGTRAEIAYFALVLDTVSENYSEMDPAASAEIARQYTAWTDRLRARDQLIEFLYLKSGDSTEGIHGVSGIVIVRATSLRALESIVADSPHVARGGTISVREIVAAEGF